MTISGWLLGSVRRIVTKFTVTHHANRILSIRGMYTAPAAGLVAFPRAARDKGKQSVKSAP